MLLMRPLFTATSAVYTSPPVPSTIVPPRTSKSTKVRLTRHDLVRRQLSGMPGRLIRAMGARAPAHARSGCDLHDEPRNPLR